MSRPVLRAHLVHALTATGAVFAMLAIIDAARGDWTGMYLWLVVAFAVDGIDGPLARRYEVTRNAAAIDGVLLDLIIDFLTYVFIPAFALYQSGLLPGWSGWFGVLGVAFSSALYFADTRMKTADNSFSGFPGCWNMVVLVFFAVEPPWQAMVGAITLLAAAMFLPVKFIHPVRTRRWRAVSLPLTAAWVGLAAAAALNDFTLPRAGEIALVAISLYLLLAGAAQQLIPPRKGG